MQDLIVIIPYFNYFNNIYMEGNLRSTRARMEAQGVPYLVVEAVLEGEEFRVGADFNLTSKSILWQKERMVNRVMEDVGKGYKNFAWVDCDIVMPDGWVEMLLEKLDEYPTVQLYSHINYLKADGSIDSRREGFASRFRSTDFAQDINQNSAGTPGGAWAARTALFEGFGIYDRHITCGSDTMMMVSLSKLRVAYIRDMKLNPGKYNLMLNAEMVRHHGLWDREFVTRLNGMASREGPDGWVGHLPVDIDHLFHGSYKRRNYLHRHHVLYECKFDPAHDLTVNDDGLLEWNSEKPELHIMMKRMFVSLSERFRL